MKSIYLGILAITLGSMGCGSGDGNDDISLFDDLYRELALARCEKEFDCCPQDSVAAYSSVENCTTHNEYYTRELAGQIQWAVLSGRVLYDGARARECMAVIRGLECTQYQADDLGCFVVPLVDSGGQCNLDFECVTGYCSFETHTCATLPALGEQCNRDCAQGSYCDFRTSVCEAAKADGAECQIETECQSLHCDYSTGAGLCGQAPACM
jgi:hypothetical protein